MLLELEKTATMKHIKAIKKQFNTKYVTKWHLAAYLKIDVMAMSAEYEIKVHKDFEAALKIMHGRNLLYDLREPVTGQGNSGIKKGLNCAEIDEKEAK